MKIKICDIKCCVFFLFRKDYILENLLLTLVDVRLFSRIGHILVARQDDISHWSGRHWTLISSPKGRESEGQKKTLALI